MDYDTLIDKVMKNELTEEEAKEYLGGYLVQKIEGIKAFCKNNNMTILTHATEFPNAIDGILKTGYRFDRETISAEEYAAQNIPIEEVIERIIDEGTIGEEKEYSWLSPKLERANNLILDQHFYNGFNGYVDLVGRKINHYGYIPCQYMVFVAYPIDQKILTDRYSQYKSEEFGTTTFIKSTVIHPKFVIGYLDVKEKEFIINEQFYQLDELKNYIPVSNPETR